MTDDGFYRSFTVEATYLSDRLHTEYTLHRETLHLEKWYFHASGFAFRMSGIESYFICS